MRYRIFAYPLFSVITHRAKPATMTDFTLPETIPRILEGKGGSPEPLAFRVLNTLIYGTMTNKKVILRMPKVLESLGTGVLE
jgi:hypothetical protein